MFEKNWNVRINFQLRKLVSVTFLEERRDAHEVSFAHGEKTKKKKRKIPIYSSSDREKGTSKRVSARRGQNRAQTCARHNGVAAEINNKEKYTNECMRVRLSSSQFYISLFHLFRSLTPPPSPPLLSSSPNAKSHNPTYADSGWTGIVAGRKNTKVRVKQKKYGRCVDLDLACAVSFHFQCVLVRH